MLHLWIITVRRFAYETKMETWQRLDVDDAGHRLGRLLLLPEKQMQPQQQQQRNKETAATRRRKRRNRGVFSVLGVFGPTFLRRWGTHWAEATASRDRSTGFNLHIPKIANPLPKNPRRILNESKPSQFQSVSIRNPSKCSKPRANIWNRGRTILPPRL